MRKLKKLFIATLLSILVLSTAIPAFAAGTVTITTSYYNVLGWSQRRVLTITWIADAAAATVPDTTINPNTYGIVGWYMYSGETNPGGTAPTDNYDIVINDADGLDIAGGLLANRDTTNTEIVNFGTSSFGYPMVRGNLTFSLSNNAVNSATGTLILTFVAN